MCEKRGIVSSCFLAWILAGLASAFGADKNSLQFSANPTASEFFRAHVFQEPLVVVGPRPSASENSDLAAALMDYSKRSGPDDFSALTKFLNEHPKSSWNAALLTDLGLEYYNTAHYSLAIEAWSNAWSFAPKARDAKSVALVSRAFGELLKMDSRLGRMDEIERLLNSIDNKPLPGPAAQHIVEAREALWNMKNRPEISFRCGPLALRSIRVALGLPGSSDAEILKSASTQKGCSLPQVAELSRKIGLNYQMAFRDSGDFVVPSVVHWKVGHYAAMIRKVGDLYELHDPTFGNNTWATKEALESETSGYFLIAAGPLPQGWRTVDEKEGSAIWGKGLTTGNDPQHITNKDLASRGNCSAHGMAVAKVHLMDVNLNLTDYPVGYTPPVGPPVQFIARYNQLDIFQPDNFTYWNLGSLWTSDWISYITDDPQNLLADVNLYVAGGGQRTYSDFNTNTQSFDYQQYDQNLLTRTGPAGYQLLYGDGSKMIFSQSDGSTGSSRNIFLTQELDPQGNAITFSYDTNMCVSQVTDAIGQVTTLTYGVPELLLTNPGNGEVDGYVPADPYKLTKVTDPFGRSATLTYEPVIIAFQTQIEGHMVYDDFTYGWALSNITDVVGITSSFTYQSVDVPVTQNYFLVNNLVNSMTTPYGTTSFNGDQNGNTRSMEITYPDNSKERVEYNQTINIPNSDPVSSVPVGMLTDNGFLEDRDTYYWDRTACSLAYGDYTKARLYHFMHTEDLASTSGALESFKLPLEGRVWFDYAGQTSSVIISSNILPAHIGRVLDDGSTQLYTYAYDPFGHATNFIDPAGRTLSLIYDTNGIDLLELRQTRAGNNDLLDKFTYNSQHRVLTETDIAGQVTAFTYNARGQLLTVTDPENQTMTCTYDTNGYLLQTAGPLAGNNEVSSLTYDSDGRILTLTSPSGYTVTCAYDALDRLTGLAFPDGTSCQYFYNILDCIGWIDRAGRQTALNYDNMRELVQATDPLGRATRFEWCRCGAPKSVTDPMGRTTAWTVDLQGRRTAKLYPDGSQAQYLYENTTSRLEQVLDENQQTTFYTYNDDDTLRSIAYGNDAVPTPDVTFSYDSNYNRVISKSDGIGVTTYTYNPVTSPPVLGAGALASVSGPLTNEVVTYAYDQLGRAATTAIDGVVTTRAFDSNYRLSGESNILGAFSYSYDGSSFRLISENFPNGQTASLSYGNNVEDFELQQLTYAIDTTPISQFVYGNDNSRDVMTSWSQQAGAQAPSVFSFGYDAVNQLLAANVTNSGAPVNAFAYSYDKAGNRLSEEINGATTTASYNALNQSSALANAPVNFRTNEWDGEHRLTATTSGNTRTEFGYDGSDRLAYIRRLQNGSQTSFRCFAWDDGQICEERDATGTNVTKRFFPAGVQLLTGTNAGFYYYTRDHLGSIRELTDVGGNVRARYSYDPYGRPTKVSGDVDADFGFAGMFWSSEASLSLTRFRAYDPNLGRWLSRDPLGDPERRQGPNLYAYVRNNPISSMDPLGLSAENAVNTLGVGVTTFVVADTALFALDSVTATCRVSPQLCIQAGLYAIGSGGLAFQGGGGGEPGDGPGECPLVTAESGENPIVEETAPPPNNVTADTGQALIKEADSGPQPPGLYTAMLPYRDTIITDPALTDTILSDETITLNLENDEWADLYLKNTWDALRPYNPNWTPEQWVENQQERLRAIDTYFEIRGRYPP